MPQEKQLHRTHMETTKKNIGLSKKHRDLSAEIDKALKKASENVIAEAKKLNSYLVVSDKDGNIKKIPAKDL